ncbi:MAG TPA: translation initiation factor [Cryomorphaceae bacterium]|nr:translation initiation factor [Cryomorphaceae bacterium]
MAKKKKRVNVVYSTNPDFNFDANDSNSQQRIPADDQDLRVWLDRKGGGKVASIIKGFHGPADDLKELSRELKGLCGVGGTAKNGEVLIQGDHRDKIVDYLKKQGYGAKKAGG